MSARTLPIRRTAVPLVAVVAALVLGPSVAAADPPSLNRNQCAVLLLRAAHFPGSFEDGTGTHRLVSDGYVSHLSAQPACTSAGG